MVYPQGGPLIRAHRDAGHTIAVASSATPFQVAPLARELGIDNLLCTRGRSGQRRSLTGKLGGPVLWGTGKADAVREFAAEQGSTSTRATPTATARRTSPTSRRSGGRGRSTRTAASPSRARARLADLPLHGRGRPGLGRSSARAPRWPAWAARSRPGSASACSTRSRRRRGQPRDRHWAPSRRWRSPESSLECDGEENLWSQRPAVFIFNHQSSLDTLIVGSLCAATSPAVAKKEAARDPRFARSALLDGRGLRRPEQLEQGALGARAGRRQDPQRELARDRARGHAHADAAARALQEGRVPHRDAGRRADRADRASATPAS